MWGRLSGSSLVIPLTYQGHLSAWPLNQFNTTSEAPKGCLLCQRNVKTWPWNSLQKHTVWVDKKIFYKYPGSSICTLSLSRRQHIQLRIYVLLSLEWSLHASSIPPLANWKSHLLTSLAFSRQINWSMNQWEGMNRLRLRGNGLIHTCIHTHQIFTIDMWVTLSITQR